MILPVNHDLYPVILGTTYDPEAMVISVDGFVKDLTGCVVQLVIRNGDSVVATLIDGAGLVVDEEKGMVAPVLTVAEAIATYTPGMFSYYLQVTEADGETIYRYAEGSLEVRN